MTKQIGSLDAGLGALLATRERTGPLPAQVGDIWHRVDGSHIGDEVYQGMDLDWTSWRCVRTTPQGAWFECVEWSHRPERFALTSGAKAICRTQTEALERLIARKKRHLLILNSETVAAQDTLEVAREALAHLAHHNAGHSAGDHPQALATQ